LRNSTRGSDGVFTAFGSRAKDAQKIARTTPFCCQPRPCSPILLGLENRSKSLKFRRKDADIVVANLILDSGSAILWNQ